MDQILLTDRQVAASLSVAKKHHLALGCRGPLSAARAPRQQNAPAGAKADVAQFVNEAAAAAVKREAEATDRSLNLRAA